MAQKDIGSSTRRSATGTPAEERREEIASEYVFEVDVEAASTKSAERRTLRAIVPEPVVLSPLLFIRENCISLLNFLEPVFRIWFSASVRVVFSSESPEAVFEFAW